MKPADRYRQNVTPETGIHSQPTAAAVVIGAAVTAAALFLAIAFLFTL